jgi:4-amino-4-deoxy-L-arabinose transferase-like glycosyltransferase
MIRSKLFLFITGAFCLYLLGNGQVSLWDRDEPRYAQTSRQMLHSGDWIVPHFLGNVRTAKPVLIYWLQASSMRVMGDNAFAARFPSAVAVTLLLAGLAVLLSRTIGPARALWSVFILGTSGIVIFCAKSCVTDGVLLLFVTAAQIGLYALWRGSRSWAVVIVMSIAIGLAGLTKGPVVLGVMTATLLVLAAMRTLDGAARERADVKPFRVSAAQVLVGICIVTAICLPWVYLMQRRVPGYLQQTFWKEIFDRARRGAEQHTGPPGYYLIFIWATFFPWSLLLPAAIVQGWKRRHISVIRFCLAAIIGPWLMFELIATKLPHYILPLLPPLALLTADMLVRAARGLHRDITNPGFARIVAGWGVLIVLVSLLPWLALRIIPDGLPAGAIWWMIILFIMTVEYVREVFVAFRAARPLHAAAVMGIGMMLLVSAVYGGYLRHARYLQTSKQIADVLRAHHARDVMMIDYKEPSLAFYQGGSIREQRDNQFLAHHPPADWPAWVVLTSRVWRETPAQTKDRFAIVESVRGLNYSNSGKVVQVLVLRRKS